MGNDRRPIDVEIAANAIRRMIAAAERIDEPAMVGCFLADAALLSSVVGDTWGRDETAAIAELLSGGEN